MELPEGVDRRTPQTAEQGQVGQVSIDQRHSQTRAETRRCTPFAIHGWGMGPPFERTFRPTSWLASARSDYCLSAEEGDAT